MKRRGRSGPIDDTPGRNVENAGPIGNSRDDLHVVPTLRQPDASLGYQDDWATVSRREPWNDVEDSHDGPCTNAVPRLAAVEGPEKRRGPSTIRGLGSRCLKAFAAMDAIPDERRRPTSCSAEE